MPQKIIDDETAVVEYYPNFLSREERSDLVSHLRSLDGWSKDRLVVYGRSVESPRFVSAQGDPGLRYTYAGTTRFASPWTPLVWTIGRRASSTAGQPFNFVLMNRYRDGKDYIGWHADKEKDIVPHSVIASVSVGAVRDFCLRNNATHKITKVALASGSLLLMKGATQSLYQHSVPKRLRLHDERFNLTFRELFVNTE